jgi:hypothetical protein
MPNGKKIVFDQDVLCDVISVSDQRLQQKVTSPADSLFLLSYLCSVHVASAYHSDICSSFHYVPHGELAVASATIEKN